MLLAQGISEYTSGVRHVFETSADNTVSINVFGGSEEMLCSAV